MAASGRNGRQAPAERRGARDRDHGRRVDRQHVEALHGLALEAELLREPDRRSVAEAEASRLTGMAMERIDADRVARRASRDGRKGTRRAARSANFWSRTAVRAKLPQARTPRARYDKYGSRSARLGRTVKSRSMRGVLTIIVLGLSVGLVCWVFIADAFEAALNEMQVCGPPNIDFGTGGVDLAGAQHQAGAVEAILRAGRRRVVVPDHEQAGQLAAQPLPAGPEWPGW